MATDSDRRTPFDLRTTIPLVRTTLIALARKPRRSWLIPFLTLIAGILFMTLMLELVFAPGPVSALAFEGELRSRLVANYGADPLGAKIQQLRLTILDEVLSPSSQGSAAGGSGERKLSDPVPTATPPQGKESTSTNEPPSATPPPATNPPTALPSATPSNTPLSTTAPVVMGGGLCSKLSIVSLWVQGDDDLKATVRNDASVKAYLTETVLEWPDVPAPAYVDWFEFDGSKYYNGDSYSSPTVKSGSSRELGAGKTRTWEADWDDEPAPGIYGSFNLTLGFTIGGESCTLNKSTFKAPPATPVPTSLPSATPAPPSPTASATPVPPTETPLPTPTETASPTPPV